MALLNKLFILTFLLSLWSCAEKSAQLSVEPPAAPLAVTPIEPVKPGEYTFEELHGVANYATVVFSRRINDQIAHKKSPKIFKCDPSDDEINVWTMQLKSLIDREEIYVEQNILTDKTYVEKFAQCEKNCMCGEYAAILQNINPSKLNKTQLFQLTDMDRKHKAMTDADSLACAKQFKNFCGSKLHKHLRKMAQQ